MNVIGIDPGLNGALAKYNRDFNSMYIIDMPTWWQLVGRKKRQRVDAVALAEYFLFAKDTGTELVVIEAVGGRPKQSASSGFVFGYTVGLLYMACVMARLPLETVPPQTWKKLLKVPGKRDTDDAETAIINRADELLPDHRECWRGPKGGKRVDRAEAAMLAKFGYDYLLPERPATIGELSTAYVNADTGA